MSFESLGGLRDRTLLAFALGVVDASPAFAFGARYVSLVVMLVRRLASPAWCGVRLVHRHA
jgi:hypothetical protein